MRTRTNLIVLEEEKDHRAWLVWVCLGVHHACMAWGDCDHERLVGKGWDQPERRVFGQLPLFFDITVTGWSDFAWGDASFLFSLALSAFHYFFSLRVCVLLACWACVGCWVLGLATYFSNWELVQLWADTRDETAICSLCLRYMLHG